MLRHGWTCGSASRSRQTVGEDGFSTGVARRRETNIPAGNGRRRCRHHPECRSGRKQPGSDVGDGIIVDQHLRSSDPDIFAAGDVACAFHPGWPACASNTGPTHSNQPAVAAGSILGRMSHSTGRRTSSPISTTWEMGIHRTSLEPGDYDKWVFRGVPPVGSTLAFWTKDARALASMNVNIWDVTDDIKALVQIRPAGGPRGLGRSGQDSVGACR